MRIRVAFSLFLGGLAAALSGCGFFDGEEREPWRAEAEEACLARKLVLPTAFTRPIEEIEGPRTCGVDHPFRVYAVSSGAVGIEPSARLGCPLTAALDVWVRDTVQPAALARFGVGVAEIKNMASYGCRTRNNRRGAKLSEHAFGNGLDIGGFILADGREVSVLRDWRKGPPEAQAFLREVHAGACGLFKTVLGPGSDGFHENHLHLDLARHDPQGRRAYCRPKPAIPAPADQVLPPPAYEDMPMSYAPDGGGWPIARLPGGAQDGADQLVTGSVARATVVDDAPFGYEPDE